MNKLIEALEKSGLNLQLESAGGDNHGTQDTDFIDMFTVVEEGRKKKSSYDTRRPVVPKVNKGVGSRKVIGPSVVSQRRSLQSVNETSDIERSSNPVGGVQSPVDVMDSPTNNFVDVSGIESTQGESPVGDCIKEEHNSLLSDPLQSNPIADVTEMQVESPIGDIRREEHDESTKVTVDMEQVSLQTAFSIEGVAHENVDYAIVVDEQVETHVQGAALVESVARGTLRESNDIAKGSVKSQNAPDSIVRGTTGESADVTKGNVKSQGCESSERNDDDFEDIMDVACDIKAFAITNTYKRRKRPELSNVSIEPPFSSLKTRGQKAMFQCCCWYPFT
ncbi:hypothetical protein K7X08_003064 [Anisodus acutangulus]|uniref:Uncharacterized protein n=1 Tax=Anisodus acutangulus TaxID=402998 RepID=A0A9Q1MGR2_9SOLA|nr:hypothetical protein K7X08_003064 [Anisodus acutangulus]